jgi:hypothetical protein
MKKHIIGTCLCAIVLWASAGAQGQGKGQGGTDKQRGPQAGKAPVSPPAADQAAEKNAGKGKAAKQADESAAKRGGTPGKKGPASTEAPDKGKGKGRDQQARAFQKQQQKEQAKHMERQARLNRIRELAVKKGDTEMVARVDKLIAKENEVYSRKQGKMLGQPRATGMTGADKTGPATTGPNDVGTRKGKSAAAEQKGKAGKQAEEGTKEPKKAGGKQEK